VGNELFFEGTAPQRNVGKVNDHKVPPLDSSFLSHIQIDKWGILPVRWTSISSKIQKLKNLEK
jgi:hypothetical protein